ncbi:MAG TPA: hypothetical protein VJN96_13370 [Vicinamibacterales bacterium]|nr:hypothetical protein [Vicinamibacterales bacterium]
MSHVLIRMTRTIGLIAVALVLLGAATHGQNNSPATEFVGTMPCGTAIRAFVGGLAADASCPAIVWKLDLGVREQTGPGWSLVATYGAPTASNPEATGAPRVSVRGRLETSATTYRLIATNGRSLVFRRLSSTLIHPLDERNRLMLGTTAYSYTLSRADATDDPGQPELRHGPDYTLSPRETGNTVFGIFDGRTPCMGLARALHLVLTDGCQRVKWRITLLQKAGSSEPTTYKIEGSLHHTARAGAWRMTRGTASDPNAIVYQLDGTATEGPMLLWRADDDVLLMLDEHRQPLVGTINFSYSLNRAQ